MPSASSSARDRPTDCAGWPRRCRSSAACCAGRRPAPPDRITRCARCATTRRRSSRPLPLLIGGGGEKVTLKLVARYGDACNIGGGVATVTRKEAILRAHCEAVGRDEAEIERTTNIGVVVIRDTEAEAIRVQRGIFRRNGNAPLWRNQPVGSPEQVAEKLAPYLAIGYRHLVAGFPAPYDEESMTRFATEVRPLLERAGGDRHPALRFRTGSPASTSARRTATPRSLACVRVAASASFRARRRERDTSSISARDARGEAERLPCASTSADAAVPVESSDVSSPPVRGVSTAGLPLPRHRHPPDGPPNPSVPSSPPSPAGRPLPPPALEARPDDGVRVRLAAPGDRDAGGPCRAAAIDAPCRDGSVAGHRRARGCRRADRDRPGRHGAESRAGHRWRPGRPGDGTGRCCAQRRSPVPAQRRSPSTSMAR